MQNKKILILILVALVFFLGILIGFLLVPQKTIPIESSQQLIKQNYKEIPIVGVDDKGIGVSGILSVEVKQGSGLVLVNINNVLADYLTQLSARNAAQIAANYTNLDLSKLDVIYAIHANASVIEGPSAGSVMAIATIAALQNKDLNPKVFMTGAIDEKGDIVEVGGIPEKAKAAKNSGALLFLIPAANYINGFEKTKSCTSNKNSEYCIIDFKPRKADVSSTFGLEVKEVKNIREALNYYLQ